ncbi:MAG: M6 family metalloprotease domain-containing protein [Muribaculaceae bacterium]|nr:M6 family metalloprotease domain-containing protein [Muribaculaceae bacterium]
MIRELLFVSALTLGASATAVQPDTSQLCGTIPSVSVSAEGTPVLVMLVEYRDIHFKHENARAYFDGILNSGEDYPDGAAGNLARYLERQSGGRFRPVFDVAGPVRLTSTRMSYGSNNSSGEDKNPENMLVQGAGLIDADVDFSRYDTDGDGKVDNIIIIFAGQDETTSGIASAVNPHRGKLSDKKKNTTKDNVMLDQYVCIAEEEADRMIGQGPLLKLILHELGLPMLGHSTNAGAGFTPGPWSVMDRGDRGEDGDKPVGLSVWERMMLGWATPQVLPPGGEITLAGNSSPTGDGYIIATERKQEYFLLENRCQRGQDACLPGQGMLIWHVDMSGVEAIGTGVNDIASHQYVDIIEACGEANMHLPELLESYAWPCGENDSFEAVSWSGIHTGVVLSEIKENEDGSVSFKVNGGSPELKAPDAPTVFASCNGSAVISWTECEGVEGYLVCLANEDSDGKEIHYSEKCVLTLNGLQAGVYYSVAVCAVAGPEHGEWSEKTMFVLPEPEWADLVPEVDAEAEFIDDGFTAQWEHMAGAESYLLSVFADFGRGVESNLLEFGHNGSKELELPRGWEWTGDASDVYLSNSYGFYGTNAPALKFDNSVSSLTSPAEEGLFVTGISFWMRGASGADESVLRLEGISREGTSVLACFVPPIDHGETVGFYDIPAGTERVRLVYEKIGGNLAIDDLRLETKHVAEILLETYDRKDVGFCDSYRVDLSAPIAKTYTYFIHALDAEGQCSAVSNKGLVNVPEGSGIDAPLASGTYWLQMSGDVLKYTGSSGDMLRVFTMDGLLRGCIMADSTGCGEMKLPAGLYIAVSPQGTAKVRVK